ncbi:MAG: paaK [Verrucomicrobiales bacterium]|nr:paaK [Verrucomicrobiales bacterium]
MFAQRDEIEKRQLEQLQTLLRLTRAQNPFYQEKLAGLALEAAPLSLSFPLPFTTKAEIVANQLAHPPFGTNLSYPPTAYTRYHQTSGTTGIPIRWIDDPASWAWMVDSWCRIFQAAGVTSEDRIYFAFSFGPFIGFWLAFEAGQKLGALCLPGGGMSTSSRLQSLLDTQSTVLCCTPTYAIRLGETIASEGRNANDFKIRKIMVAGEPGGSVPQVRMRLKNLWPHATVFDHHGMTEVGPVSYACPSIPNRLHIMEERYFAEILNPVDASPCSPGTPGELVLTTLGRLGSPLIRYRTGDLVASHAGASCCECGSWELALEGGILGRTDDMVVVRGVNVYPSAIEAIIRTFPEIEEFQVDVFEQNALTELSVNVEPRENTENARLIADLQRQFQVLLNLRIPVKLAAPGQLPRFEMKARRWVKHPAPTH